MVQITASMLALVGLVATASAAPQGRVEARSNAKIVPTVGHFEYSGCYVDSDARLLPTKALSDGTVSAETCAKACPNSKYFGLEYGHECWCDDSLHLSATSYALAGKGDCQNTAYKCAGNNSEFCGAYWRIAVYEQTPLNGPLPTAAQALGCYADQYMPSLYYAAYKGAQDSTPLKCFNACKQQGFQYSGLQNGSDCYCDNSLNLANAQGANATGCTTPCTGEDRLTCGGDKRVQIAQDTSFVPNVVFPGFN